MGALPKDLDRDYDHHSPRTAEEGDPYADVCSAARRLAEEIDKLVPPGRERSIAHTKLEEAMMWTDAGVARAGYDDAE